MNTSLRRRLQACAATLIATGVALVVTGAPASADAGHALIQGSGSSWSANAVNQWIADVHSNGLQVVFTSNGSAQGRKDYANDTVDFAVSDIGYQGTDPATGQDDTSQGRKYAYLPIVAGGTSLPYQIRVGGQLVRNLRLSGETITKIFTQKITNWDDPEITADNNGHALPSLAIIPVQHSEGSGSTYQFTRYMATEFASIWKPFAGGLGATEYFPPPTGSAIAENGSDGVMNFLSSGAANGAIGYDEYSYALGKNYPVAKVLNSAGYYTLPTQYNVAVALTKAQINTDPTSPDYLLQDLDSVYTYGDKRVYPMSSYSYAIIPTASDDKTMTTAKRQTLADYLQYAVCQGQAEMGRIGYSPLPINLVQASFNQVKLLNTADSGVDVSSENVASCHNPTFIAGHPTENYLAHVAPQPESCDKQGAGPCTDDGNTGQLNPNQGGGKTNKGGTNGSGTVATGGSGTSTGGSGTSTGGSGGGGSGGSSGSGGSTGGSGSGGSGSGSGGSAAGGSTTGATGGSATGATGGSATGATGGSATGLTSGSTTGGAGNTGTGGGTHTDPTTGQQVANTTTNGGVSAVADPTSLADSQSRNTDLTLGVIAGALLLGALIAPAFVATRMSKRKS